MDWGESGALPSPPTVTAQQERQTLTDPPRAERPGRMGTWGTRRILGNTQSTRHAFWHLDTQWGESEVRWQVRG